MSAGAQSENYREWRRLNFIAWAQAGFPKKSWVSKND